MESDGPVICPCGKPIEKQVGETIRQFEKRRDSGYCRARCKKDYPKRGRVVTLETPTRAKANFSLLPKSSAAPRQFTGSLQKNKRAKNPSYLAWVRSRGCVVCRKNAIAHHVSAGGMGTKCDDTLTIPLCDPFGHHSELHRIGKRTFEQKYGVDLISLAEKFFLEYSAILNK